MPAALRLHLTDDERAEVAQCFETTREAETRLRYQMVLLAADGYTAPQIAPMVRWGAAARPPSSGCCIAIGRKAPLACRTAAGPGVRRTSHQRGRRSCGA